MRLSQLTLAAALLATAAACAGPAEAPAPKANATQPVSGGTLIMAVRFEVTDLAGKIPGGGSPVVTKRLFNAALALIDGQGNARPYLAESLPQLGTGSWQVYPDGRMETTYRLRTGLSWQDGQPLTADDFTFAHQVYASPLRVFIPTPQDQIESVRAADSNTVIVHWRTPNANAGAIKFGDFEPLPRHILEEPFRTYEQDQGTRDTFLNLPFWTTQYIGLGPFTLEHWQPGVELAADAFNGHALGRPKIDHLILRIFGDENTVLSNVLAGAVQFTADFTLRFEHAQVLKRDWEAAGKGRVVFKASGAVSNSIQLRPEYAGDPGLLDPRVRQAMAFAIDRETLNSGLFQGQGFTSEDPIPKGVAYHETIDRAFVQHPYDPRRAAQLMRDAGFNQVQEGFFTHPDGRRFSIEYRAIAGPEFERSQALLIDTWKRSGFEVTSAILPANLVRDLESMHTFSGLATRGGGLQERTFSSAETGTSANRWVGENRSGWANDDYDRLLRAFAISLDGPERLAQLTQMLKLVSEYVPIFVLYQAIQVNSYVSSLKGPGPEVAGFGSMTPAALSHWNIHEWELTQSST